MTGRRIRLLGDPAIFDEDGRRQTLRGHQAWALLARILLARQPVDRRRLSTELFPETADPLGALRWCLASLRKALDCADCLTGDPVEFGHPGRIDVDVWNLDAEDFDVAAAGPLLGNFEPRSSPEFATWLLVERARLAGVLESRIRHDTLRAISVGDHLRAVRLAEIGARQNPFDEPAHVLLVKSLALSGQYDSAVRHAEATEAVFLAELGERPSPALRSAARRTIASPPAGVSAGAHIKSLLRSGAAALAAGAVDAGIETLRLAAQEAEKGTDHHLHATALLELGKGLIHGVRGFDDEGSVLLRQSSELAQGRGYEKIAANALTELGYVEALAGRRPSAAKYLQEGKPFVSDSGDIAELHAVTAFNLVDWGKVGEGLEHCSISLEHARKTKGRKSEIWTLGLGARGQLAVDDLDRADVWLTNCLSLVDELNWLSFRPWPIALLAETRLRRGDDVVAIRKPLEEAYALSRQLCDPCWEAACARAFALTFSAEGDYETALQWLDIAYLSCARETDPFVSLKVEILASQAEISRQHGHHRTADAFAREWVSLAARTHMDAHVERASAFISQSAETANPATGGASWLDDFGRQRRQKARR